MISLVIRLLLKALGTNLLPVDQCGHRTPEGGQAFAAFRHDETNHIFICTQCGQVDREVYDRAVSAKIEKAVKNLTRNGLN